MCWRASVPFTTSTTWPRTSDQSQESESEWISTVIRGSRRMFLARCRCGSVFTRRYSPSLSTHVSSACGWPSGISVTTVARFLPWARRTVSSSSTICSPRLALSVAVYRHDRGPGDRVEPEVEAGHRGGDVGVDAELVGVERVDGEHVTVWLVALRRCRSAEVLGAVVVAHRERAGGKAGAVAAASARRQFGDRRRYVQDQPVPEPGSGRGVGIEGGHREALGLGREAAPAQVRGDVLARHP